MPVDKDKKWSGDIAWLKRDDSDKDKKWSGDLEWIKKSGNERRAWGDELNDIEATGTSELQKVENVAIPETLVTNTNKEVEKAGDNNH